jgi:hypothetical protein
VGFNIGLVFCELDIELDDLPPLKETDKLENLLEK